MRNISIKTTCLQFTFMTIFGLTSTASASPARAEFCSALGGRADVKEQEHIVTLNLRKNGHQFLLKSGRHPTLIYQGATAAQADQAVFALKGLLGPNEQLLSGKGYSFRSLGDPSFYVSILTYSTKSGKELMLIRSDSQSVIFAGSNDTCPSANSEKQEIVTSRVSKPGTSVYEATAESKTSQDYGSSANSAL